MVVAKGCGEEDAGVGGAVVVNGDRVSVGEDEEVLEVGGGDGCTM